MNLQSNDPPLVSFFETFRRFLREWGISVAQGNILGLGPKPRIDTLNAWIDLMSAWREVDALLSAVPVDGDSGNDEDSDIKALKEYILAVDAFLNGDDEPYEYSKAVTRLMDAHESVIARFCIAADEKKGGRK